MTLIFSTNFVGRMPKPVSGDISEALKCTKCGDLLFNAMLITECGCKFCERPCYQEILSDRRCPGDTEDCGPFEHGIADKGTRRNILGLKVYCIYDCGHTGVFKDLPAHLAECPKRPVECRFCQSSFPHCDFEAHVKSCDRRSERCGFCHNEILISKLAEHHDLRSPECCPEYVGKCPYCDRPSIRRSDINLHKMECGKWPIECPFKCHGCNFEGTDYKKHMEDAVAVHQTFLLKIAVEQNTKLKAENENVREENERLRQRCLDFENRERELQEQFDDKWKKLKKVQAILAVCREKQIDTDKIVQRYGDVDQLLGQLHSSNSSSSQNPQAFAALNSYNGLYVWKIDNFRRRRTQARNGTSVSITSEPFYSEPYGYKMCCRVYLNGDGSGKGTYLSVFIVIMKSDFDAVLKWPFTNRVTFTLINQERGENRVEAFTPDQRSHSFKRPVDDMNIASGCPRFISFTQLEGSDNRSAFLQDDCIFLKIEIVKLSNR